MIDLHKTHYWQWWNLLADWHGLWTTTLIAFGNTKGGDCDWDDQALWNVDSDFTRKVSHWLDIESLLALGGCLDGDN